MLAIEEVRLIIMQDLIRNSQYGSISTSILIEDTEKLTQYVMSGLLDSKPQRPQQQSVFFVVC